MIEWGKVWMEKGMYAGWSFWVDDEHSSYPVPEPICWGESLFCDTGYTWISTEWWIDWRILRLTDIPPRSADDADGRFRASNSRSADDKILGYLLDPKISGNFSRSCCCVHECALRCNEMESKGTKRPHPSSRGDSNPRPHKRTYEKLRDARRIAVQSSSPGTLCLPLTKTNSQHFPQDP